MRESFIIANLAEADHIDIPIYQLMLYNTYYSTKIGYRLYERFLEPDHLDFLVGVQSCCLVCGDLDYTSGVSIADKIENCGMFFGQRVENQVALSEIRSLKYDRHDMFNSLSSIYRIMTSAKVFEKHNASIAMIVMSAALTGARIGGVLYKDGRIFCTDTVAEYMTGVQTETLAEYVDEITSYGLYYGEAMNLAETVREMGTNEFYMAAFAACAINEIEDNVEDVIDGVRRLFRLECNNKEVWRPKLTEILTQYGYGDNKAACVSLEMVMYAYSKYF